MRGKLLKNPLARFYRKREEETPLPEYTLRRSQRARRLQIRVMPGGKVEVVLPRGCHESRGHAMVREKALWIHQTLEKIASRVSYSTALPDELHLRAIGEHWRIRCLEPMDIGRVELVEAEDELVFSGATGDEALCVQALRQWLAKKGRKVLAPWLRQVSDETGLSYNRVSVRGQKTRWGSCSAKHTISLNYKLLFVPAEQVRYLLIHELCHTRHLNHSATFWALVGNLEPDYKRLDKALSRATREQVPGCLN